MKREEQLKFPDDFLWGTATASYQIEGGFQEGGREWSIWDSMCHAQKRIHDGSSGDVACDHYHRFEEDIRIMQSMGLKNYRLSIAWPRIQPTGRGAPNPEGIAFYNRLIDCLLEHGIEPLVTLYHWDLPLALQIEHNGWLGRELVPAFADYARICFDAFGDRVKRWLTLNEPWCSTVLGYGTGEHAPGITSDDGSKVYLSGHHILLAHASAVKVYRTEFKDSQKGTIGVTLNVNWAEPEPSTDATINQANKDTAERCMVWCLAWFADPIWKGDYPAAMKERCGDRLPSFTDEEKELMKGSSDVFGLNHYSTDMVKAPDHRTDSGDGGYFGDIGSINFGDPSWSRTDMGWCIVPFGMRKTLLWIKERYNPPGGIIVTENGCACAEPTVESAVQDTDRVNYYESYVTAVHEAIEQGVDVKGYFAWSLVDNFEWAFGYSKRFGLVRVDYTTQVRTLKASAHWLAQTVKDNAVKSRYLVLRN